MKIYTKANYVHLTKALLKAGYTVDTVFEALEATGFSAEVEGNLYEGIYVNRVKAIMYEALEAEAEAKPKAEVKPLQL